MSTKIFIARSMVICLVFLVTVFTSSTPVAAATDQLPDLGMARLQDLQIQITTDGHRLLRFSTIIVNVGSGAFEVRGERPDTSTPTMTVTQRIYDDAGGYRDVPTTAEMFFAGDGHNHWHVRDLQTYELIRKDNGVKVGTGAKTGFCFYDGAAYNSSLPGFSSTRVYTGCGSSGDLTVVMGLSVGRQDIYPYTMAFQYIDITGLTAGRYRLQVTADNYNFFQESNESNNLTWVDIQLLSKTGTKFKILAYGPPA
jgi:hypothetical protein